MQYLSKAYNYYSGINPATLSGAIDVIVIRHTDADGNVNLSSSPFHVRFGKLQVLRAAEKRVTITMPNNLPAPHIAPFSMKVGETGEAFFVLETDEEVPEDLLTSPVIMATPAAPPVLSPSSQMSQHPGRQQAQSLTQQPFGETEELADHGGEVEYLDLNADHNAPIPQVDPKTLEEVQAVFPSSILGAGSSSLPSSASGFMTSPLDFAEENSIKAQRHPVPNPLQAKPGEMASLPKRDRRLSERSQKEEELPKVEHGHGDGPEVLYGKDMVFDMSGYHSAETVAAVNGEDSLRRPSRDEKVIDLFGRDLLAAAHIDSRPSLQPRSTDPTIQQMSDLSLQSQPLAKIQQRGERATSEPPPELESPEPLTDESREPDWDNHLIERRETLPTLGSHESPSTRLKNVDDNPFLYVLECDGRSHFFELGLCDEIQDEAFLENRISFQRFIEDAQLVDEPRLVIRYSLQYLTWAKNYQVLYALALYRRSLTPAVLPPLSELGVGIDPPRAGQGWSRWWRRAQTKDLPPEPPKPTEVRAKHYVKTLRLSSEQLVNLSFTVDDLLGPTYKQMNLQLKPGPNTVQFSATSSYSGQAICTARIFLWESTDQIVISDIDGTITKSDALGHVFAAIGRDWTHLGIAKLYTDIANNGYRMLYLTSRAIGQADSTREYLRTINQGDYRLPEGPVIMSPDRLMASLHREVVMRKPELFKMACLRDIQRLFGEEHAKDAFFAGFGNRITDAMSYRSVGIEAAKIYTIDSNGVVKTELLQSAGHKGSYILLNDLVNETFPPVGTKVKPEFTDFSYWRPAIADVPLPDLSPPSPTLSARSDTSGRLSVLGRVLGRRSSRPMLPNTEPSSRPASPLMGPALSSDDLSDDSVYGGHSRSSSMPGSFEDEKGTHFPATFSSRDEPNFEHAERGGYTNNIDDDNDEGDDDQDNFDDDLLATGEMQNVPF